MASTSGPVHRLLVRNDTTSLDAAGVHLVLDGRLSSAEGREGLAAALRQASQHSADLRSKAEVAAPEACKADDAAAPGPTCLTSQAHQLPADVLNAFQAGASATADVTAGNSSAAQPQRRPGGSRSTGGTSSSSSSSTLVQQDSLVHPPIAVARSRSQPGNGSSSSNGGAASSSPRQRPPISTAIERTSTATLDANGGVDHGAGMHDPGCTCPPYAVKSTCGKRQAMEDTYALCPNICELPMSPMAHEYADKLPHRIAVQFETHCMFLPAADGQQPQPQHGAVYSPSANGLSAATPHEQQQPLSVQRQGSRTLAVAALQQQPSDAQQQHAAAASAPLAEDTAAAFAGAANLLPPGLAAAPDAENSVSSISSSEGGSVEKLHFFGVYDGHGGIEASAHCAQRLHYHLSRAMADMASMWLESSIGGEAAGSWNPEVRYVPLDTARVGESTSPGDCPLAATAVSEDAAAAAASDGSAAPSSSMGGSSSSTAERDLGRSISQTSTGNSGGQDCEVDSNEGSADGSEGTQTSFCGMMEDVLREAFLKTDEEFSNSGLQAGLVGSTAVVALVGTHRVWIANCGDSRAVLSRAGVAIQVTDDHKPEREDEAERVEKAGGQVLYWNGHRVMGVLAMSRAIGDHCLRPYVIPEPEISVFARHPRDEILLLASDGLWDVLSNQDATDLALRSIKRAREKGASRKAAARVAATVLTKAAVDRGSRDNITVVIIDLAPAGGERAACEKAAANANGPPSPDSNQQRRSPVRERDACFDEAAAAGSSAGADGRPSSSGSSSKSRPGSSKGSCGVSNPFAAAAVSPFSTAATGSSELPLPSGASSSAAGGAGSDVLAAAAAAAVERSNRTSASSGRLRSSATGGASGSVFAAAANASASICSSGISTGMSGMSSGAGSSSAAAAGLRPTLSKELDSIDLSGVAASHGAAPPSIESMAAASSAAEGSTTSSSLEEQPTIVEPPATLTRQTSSSPFSTFQTGTPFGDGSD